LIVFLYVETSCCQHTLECRALLIESRDSFDFCRALLLACRALSIVLLHPDTRSCQYTLECRAPLIQGGEDSSDPLSCRSFSTKEPLNICHFCEK